MNLVDENGDVRLGILEEPLEFVNYADYPLQTPMGYRVPAWIRRIRANQFCFIGIPGNEYIMGLAVADLHSIANAFFYIYDRESKRIFEASGLALSGKNVSIDPRPDRIKACFKNKGLFIELDSGRIYARGRDISLEAEMKMQEASPFRICTRSSYRGWVYVQKTNPVKIRGELSAGGKKAGFSSPQYMASIDWTAGYMRRKTWWNWVSVSGMLPDKRALGLNLSCGVNETGFTENFFSLGEDRTKVDTVHFDFDRSDLSRPWRITSFDRRVDLRFLPEEKRGEKVNALVFASCFTQLMGTCEGMLVTETGETVRIKGLAGFAEDHYAKW